MWQSILKVAGLILLDLAMLVSLFLIPLGLAGNWILLGLAILAAWLGGFQSLGWLALLLMLLFVVIGEVLEALLGSAMAKKFGASWWGVLGAFAGSIAGAIVGSMLLPVIGTLIGAFLGAAAGAMLLEAWNLRRMDHEAMKAGWGAFIGKMLAAMFKLSVGIGIVVYVVMRTH